MSPDERIATIASAQHGAFTVAQAYRAGFTSDSVRRRRETRRWLAPYRGVYAIAGAPKTWEGSVSAAVLASGMGAAAAGPTAAAILGLIEQKSDDIHVLVAWTQRRRGRTGIALHRADLRRSDLRTVCGIRVTAPNRTLVDCAAVLTPNQLEAAIDAALFHGLTSAAALQRYVRERRLGRRPGIGRLHIRLADRDAGSSHSRLERIFFQKLRESKLPKPARQFQVGPRFIDIGYPEQRTIIELDGRESRFSAADFRADRQRQNEIVLALPGWTLLRFTWYQVKDEWPAVEHSVRQALDG